MRFGRMPSSTVRLLLDTLRLRSDAPAEALRARWATVATKGLRALVEYEGVQLWLLRRLQELEAMPPASFRDKLRRSALRVSTDNARIDAQTLHVVSLLDAAAIPVALIKGQARRAAAKRYPYADARPLSDVDLLVPESDADRAWEMLRASGFRRVYPETLEVDWTADHHRPTLIDDSGVSVELHTTIGEGVSPTEAWHRASVGADAVEWEGRTVRVPNATELLWQALSHAVSDGTRGFRLRTFHSMAVILASDAAIDWATIEARIAQREIRASNRVDAAPPERAREILGVAASLAGVTLPVAVRPHTVPDLMPLLRWRGAVLTSSHGESVRDRLLEEALRHEAHLPLTPATRKRGMLRSIRRSTASAAARVAYVAWRATAGKRD